MPKKFLAKINALAAVVILPFIIFKGKTCEQGTEMAERLGNTLPRWKRKKLKIDGEQNRLG